MSVWRPFQAYPTRATIDPPGSTGVICAITGVVGRGSPDTVMTPSPSAMARQAAAIPVTASCQR